MAWFTCRRLLVSWNSGRVQKVDKKVELPPADARVTQATPADVDGR